MANKISCHDWFQLIDWLIDWLIWLKNYVAGKTIAGTTDSPTELSSNPAPKEAEIQFILSEIKHYLSADVDGESYSNINSYLT